MKIGNKVILNVKIYESLWGTVRGKTNEKISNKLHRLGNELLLSPIRLSIIPCTNIKYENR